MLSKKPPEELYRNSDMASLSFCLYSCSPPEPLIYSANNGRSCIFDSYGDKISQVNFIYFVLDTGLHHYFLLPAETTGSVSSLTFLA